MRRLEALLKARREQAFAWGSNDCCMWAADVVQAVTGTDPAADLRGRYSTEGEAHSVIDAAGGLAALAAARLGPEVPVLCARAGDVGLLQQPDGTEALAACLGPHWQAVTPAGLWTVPTSWVVRCWRCEVI